MVRAVEDTKRGPRKDRVSLYKVVLFSIHLSIGVDDFTFLDVVSVSRWALAQPRVRVLLLGFYFI